MYISYENSSLVVKKKKNKIKYKYRRYYIER